MSCQIASLVAFTKSRVTFALNINVYQNTNRLSMVEPSSDAAQYIYV